MMHKPTLQVRRLRVVKGTKPVYDENFKTGVNIIRGANSSGKSSIMDLLFFGLGGDFIAWKPEPLSCDLIYLEARFNNEIVVLRREITEKKNQPLWIYYGLIDEALKDADGWTRYGYTRSDDRESFSQAIFRLLGIPDVVASDDSNLTIHQVLRLLYVDQLTPVSRIFRLEQFDTPQRRQAIGDLLLGAYDKRIYPLQITLREKEKEFEKISRDLTNLYRLLGQAGESLTIDFIEAVEANIRSDLLKIEERIESLRQTESKQLEETKRGQSGIIEKMRSDLKKLSNQISSLKNEISDLEFSIEDSKELVLELSKNVQQLADGFKTSQALGGLNFSFCPSCYTLIEETPETICCLCKAPSGEHASEDRLGRVRAQIELQMKESDRLIGMKAQRLQEKAAVVKKLETLRESLQHEYQTLQSSFASESKVALEQAISELGYKRRELEEAAEKKEKISFISRLQEQKSSLNLEISEIKSILERLEIEAKRRRSRATEIVEQKAAYLLARDLKSEKEFLNPKVDFSFWDDNISVNERRSFSASSLTVLRNSVHVGLLWASTIETRMLYPRFLMLDNIEDKGMTNERSWNFQRLITEISSNIESEHQIILTTSMIAPELDESDLVIGEHYTFERKSLNLT